MRLPPFLAGALLCLSLPALADDKLRFSLIRTATTKPVPQAMVTASGSWFSGDPSNHVAVLVEHGQQRFLFDTGWASRPSSSSSRTCLTGFAR